jgi:hypothetical protein
VACSIDTSALFSDSENYLFIFGTGFSTKSASGSFLFKSIPDASHEVFLVSIPQKGKPAGIGDSLTVYALSSGIGPGNTNLLQVGVVQARIPIPDSLKTL